GTELPRRSEVTRSLGIQPSVVVDDAVRMFKLEPGDRLLLCSDGLWEPVPEERLSQRLASSRNPREACRALIEEALEHGGPDNIAALVLDIDGFNTIEMLAEDATSVKDAVVA